MHRRKLFRRCLSFMMTIIMMTSTIMSSYPVQALGESLFESIGESESVFEEVTEPSSVFESNYSKPSLFDAVPREEFSGFANPSSSIAFEDLNSELNSIFTPVEQVPEDLFEPITQYPDTFEPVVNQDIVPNQEPVVNDITPIDSNAGIDTQADNNQLDITLYLGNDEIGWYPVKHDIIDNRTYIQTFVQSLVGESSIRYDTYYYIFKKNVNGKFSEPIYTSYSTSFPESGEYAIKLCEFDINSMWPETPEKFLGFFASQYVFKIDIDITSFNVLTGVYSFIYTRYRPNAGVYLDTNDNVLAKFTQNPGAELTTVSAGNTRDVKLVYICGQYGVPSNPPKEAYKTLNIHYGIVENGIYVPIEEEKIPVYVWYYQGDYSNLYLNFKKEDADRVYNRFDYAPFFIHSSKYSNYEYMIDPLTLKCSYFLSNGSDSCIHKLGDIRFNDEFDVYLTAVVYNSSIRGYEAAPFNKVVLDSELQDSNGFSEGYLFSPSTEIVSEGYFTVNLIKSSNKTIAIYDNDLNDYSSRVQDCGEHITATLPAGKNYSAYAVDVPELENTNSITLNFIPQDLEFLDGEFDIDVRYLKYRSDTDTVEHIQLRTGEVISYGIRPSITIKDGKSLVVEGIPDDGYLRFNVRRYNTSSNFRLKSNVFLLDLSQQGNNIDIECVPTVFESENYSGSFEDIDAEAVRFVTGEKISGLKFAIYTSEEDYYSDSPVFCWKPDDTSVLGREDLCHIQYYSPDDVYYMRIIEGLPDNLKIVKDLMSFNTIGTNFEYYDEFGCVIKNRYTYDPQKYTYTWALYEEGDRGKDIKFGPQYYGANTDITCIYTLSWDAPQDYVTVVNNKTKESAIVAHGGEISGDYGTTFTINDTLAGYTYTIVRSANKTEDLEFLGITSDDVSTRCNLVTDSNVVTPFSMTGDYSKSTSVHCLGDCQLENIPLHNYIETLSDYKVHGRGNYVATTDILSLPYDKYKNSNTLDSAIIRTDDQGSLVDFEVYALDKSKAIISPVSGITFGIYSDFSCDENSFVGSAISNENGIALFTDVLAGIYFVKVLDNSSDLDFNTEEVKVLYVSSYTSWSYGEGSGLRVRYNTWDVDGYFRPSGSKDVFQGGIWIENREPGYFSLLNIRGIDSGISLFSSEDKINTLGIPSRAEFYGTKSVSNFKKVDQDGNPLAGAVFGIWENNGVEGNPKYLVQSEENGHIDFTQVVEYDDSMVKSLGVEKVYFIPAQAEYIDLPYSTTLDEIILGYEDQSETEVVDRVYSFKEVTPPDGYTIKENFYRLLSYTEEFGVRCCNETDWSKGGLLNWKNSAVFVNEKKVGLYKVDEFGNPLKHFKFSITANYVTYYVYSDDEGKIDFTKYYDKDDNLLGSLPYNTIFSLEEKCAWDTSDLSWSNKGESRYNFVPYSGFRTPRGNFSIYVRRSSENGLEFCESDLDEENDSNWTTVQTLVDYRKNYNFKVVKDFGDKTPEELGITSVTVQLYQKKVNSDEPPIEVGDPVVLNADNWWEHTWYYEIPILSEDGEDLTYFVKEILINDNDIDYTSWDITYSDLELAYIYEDFVYGSGYFIPYDDINSTPLRSDNFVGRSRMTRESLGGLMQTITNRYTPKGFWKVDDEGNPVKDAIFLLSAKCNNGNAWNINSGEEYEGYTMRLLYASKSDENGYVDFTRVVRIEDCDYDPLTKTYSISEDASYIDLPYTSTLDVTSMDVTNLSDYTQVYFAKEQSNFQGYKDNTDEFWIDYTEEDGIRFAPPVNGSPCRNVKDGLPVWKSSLEWKNTPYKINFEARKRFEDKSAEELGIDYVMVQLYQKKVNSEEPAVPYGDPQRLDASNYWSYKWSSDKLDFGNGLLPLKVDGYDVTYYVKEIEIHGDKSLEDFDIEYSELMLGYTDTDFESISSRVIDLSDISTTILPQSYYKPSNFNLTTIRPRDTGISSDWYKLDGVTQVITNTPKKIGLYKVDENGNPVSNVTFRVNAESTYYTVYSNEDGYIDFSNCYNSDGEYIGELPDSDDFGSLYYGREIGEGIKAYYLSEEGLSREKNIPAYSEYITKSGTNGIYIRNTPDTGLVFAERFSSNCSAYEVITDLFYDYIFEVEKDFGDVSPEELDITGVKVQLYQQVVGDENRVSEFSEPIELNSDNDWKYRWEGLHIQNEMSEDVTYFVKEIEVISDSLSLENFAVSYGDIELLIKDEGGNIVGNNKYFAIKDVATKPFTYDNFVTRLRRSHSTSEGFKQVITNSRKGLYKLDEFGNPIEGAVFMIICDRINVGNSTRYYVKSDSNGFLDLTKVYTGSDEDSLFELPHSDINNVSTQLWGWGGGKYYPVYNIVEHEAPYGYLEPHKDVSFEGDIYFTYTSENGFKYFKKNELTSEESLDDIEWKSYKEFVNYRHTYSFEVKKEFVDSTPLELDIQSVTVELYQQKVNSEEDAVVIKTIKLSEANNWTYIWDVMNPSYPEYGEMGDKWNHLLPIIDEEGNRLTYYVVETEINDQPIDKSVWNIQYSDLNVSYTGRGYNENMQYNIPLEEIKTTSIAETFSIHDSTDNFQIYPRMDDSYCHFDRLSQTITNTYKTPTPALPATGGNGAEPFYIAGILSMGLGFSLLMIAKHRKKLYPSV